jgi:hypothetical protein
MVRPDPALYSFLDLSTDAEALRVEALFTTGLGSWSCDVELVARGLLTKIDVMPSAVLGILQHDHCTY